MLPSDLPSKQHYSSEAVTIVIDPAAATVTHCSENARQLLGDRGERAQGQSLWAVLGISADSNTVLAQALKAQLSIDLPPFVVGRDSQTATLVEGSTRRANTGNKHAFELILEPLPIAETFLADSIESGDYLAMLGVDQISYGADWQLADTSRLMIELRSGLLEILREQDVVGIPDGPRLEILLKSTAADEARDIAVASLSHLGSIPPTFGRAAHPARICIGLCSAGGTPEPLPLWHSTLQALQRAQYSQQRERIHFAEPGDEPQLAGQILHQYRSARGDRPDREQSRFLSKLGDLPLHRQRSERYFEALIDLLLSQAGVAAVGLFRRHSDNSYTLAAGGLNCATGARHANLEQLPGTLRKQAGRLPGSLGGGDNTPVTAESGTCIVPLATRSEPLGCLLIDALDNARPAFIPDIAARHLLALNLSRIRGWQDESEAQRVASVEGTPLETGIQGYVGDNMEGAVDQAIFLAKLDIPIAVVGPRGTGKMYIANIIHQQANGDSGRLVSIDCREFRNRNEAIERIGRELAAARGNTLVFKSPHLMHADAQIKLGRQLASRTLADVSPASYLPAATFVALFPDHLDALLRSGNLASPLASVFAGYPIEVPPIKDRKRAVLRWAHKILDQECQLRQVEVKGFTPDAEQALLKHDWPGNISEMRQCIATALERNEREWLTPVDLGLFRGINLDSRPESTEPTPFLKSEVLTEAVTETYAPSALEQLDNALALALSQLLQQNAVKPIGTWLDDEIIIGACERYRNDGPAAARFLQTRPRNIGRWMEKILSRDHERNSESLWQESRRLIHQWIRETSPGSTPPQQRAEELLLSHVLDQCADAKLGVKARILGVSTPTFQKRLQQRQNRNSENGRR